MGALNDIISTIATYYFLGIQTAHCSATKLHLALNQEERSIDNSVLTVILVLLLFSYGKNVSCWKNLSKWDGEGGNKGECSPRITKETIKSMKSTRILKSIEQIFPICPTEILSYLRPPCTFQNSQDNGTCYLEENLTMAT